MRLTIFETWSVSPGSKLIRGRTFRYEHTVSFPWSHLIFSAPPQLTDTIYSVVANQRSPWSQSCQPRTTSAKPLPTRSSVPWRTATCCSGVVQNPDLIGSPLVLERHRQPNPEPQRTHPCRSAARCFPSRSSRSYRSEARTEKPGSSTIDASKAPLRTGLSRRLPSSMLGGVS